MMTPERIAELQRELAIAGGLGPADAEDALDGLARAVFRVRDAHRLLRIVLDECSFVGPSGTALRERLMRELSR